MGAVMAAEYRIEPAQQRWYIVITEKPHDLIGHGGVRIEITKRIGPFASQDLARRFADQHLPVRPEGRIGDIYDEDGQFLGSSLRQAARALGVSFSAISLRVVHAPDGRRIIRKARPRKAARVVSEDGRFLGNSLHEAAEKLGVTHYTVSRRVVARHEDGTTVIRLSRMKRRGGA